MEEIARYGNKTVEDKDWYKKNRQIIDQMTTEGLVIVEKGGKKITWTPAGEKKYTAVQTETLNIAPCELIRTFLDNLKCKLDTAKIGSKTAIACNDPKMQNRNAWTMPVGIEPSKMEKQRLANTYKAQGLYATDMQTAEKINQCALTKFSLFNEWSSRTLEFSDNPVIIFTEYLHTSEGQDMLKALIPADYQQWLADKATKTPPKDTPIKASDISHQTKEKSFKREMGERAAIGLTMGTLARGGSELGKSLAKKK